MNEKAKRTRKAHIKRRKFDSMRSLRVVKYFDYPFVLENSFIEVTEGYIFRTGTLTTFLPRSFSRICPKKS